VKIYRVIVNIFFSFQIYSKKSKVYTVMGFVGHRQELPDIFSVTFLFHCDAPGVLAGIYHCFDTSQ
jgi:hypothetical protein